jgi:subtilisin-like proprotein convertase family protein
MIGKRSARAALLASVSFAALGLVIGAAPAAAKTKTKTATFNQCVSGAAPILDRLANSLSVNVAVPKNGKKIQSGTITSFTSTAVRITHTYTGDLDVVLISPAGVAVPLAIERGGSSEGYGNGAPDCTGGLVAFSDAFRLPASEIDNNNISNPVTGQFKPETPLSAFVGGPARGLWTLAVHDCCDEDTGSINALSLQFTYTYKAPAKKRKGGK